MQKKYERIVWNFMDGVIDKSLLPQTLELFNHPLYTPSNAGFMKSIIAEFRAERNKELAEDIYSRNIQRHYLNIMLLHFLRYKDAYTVNDKKITNPTIERLIAYVNENYNKPITLKDISVKLKLTPNYLSALFRASTGMGFKDFLSGTRIKQACGLLERTDKPVSDIAHECGFNDSNYFSSAFKQVVGYPPSQYRCRLK